MSNNRLLERAYAIAGSGKCRSSNDLLVLLKAEGFGYAELQQLQSRSVARDLMRLRRTADAASPDPITAG